MLSLGINTPRLGLESYGDIFTCRCIWCWLSAGTSARLSARTPYMWPFHVTIWLPHSVWLGFKNKCLKKQLWTLPFSKARNWQSIVSIMFCGPSNHRAQIQGNGTSSPTYLLMWQVSEIWGLYFFLTYFPRSHGFKSPHGLMVLVFFWSSNTKH